MIKKRTIPTKQEIYYQECEYCHREIKGSSNQSVVFNMDSHIKSKHFEEHEKLMLEKIKEDVLR